MQGSEKIEVLQKIFNLNFTSLAGPDGMTQHAEVLRRQQGLDGFFGF
jgi:hypothetical protein